jgi:hypothetical protein
MQQIVRRLNCGNKPLYGVPMRSRVWRRSILGLCVLAASAPIRAHHSIAMYDQDHPVTLFGTVTRFEWSNPHAFIELDVAEGGIYKHYDIECASPNVLTRAGWKFNDMKPGDKVRLLVNPLRNGKMGGMLEQATFSDGRVLGAGNVAPKQRQKESPQQ